MRTIKSIGHINTIAVIDTISYDQYNAISLLQELSLLTQRVLSLAYILDGAGVIRHTFSEHK